MPFFTNRAITPLASAPATATTWNNSDKSANISLSGSFRTVTKITNDQYAVVRSVASIGAAAKVYFEGVLNTTIDHTGISFGFARASFGLDANPLGFETPTQSFSYASEGARFDCLDSISNFGSLGGPAWSNGTVIGIAWDRGAGLAWGKNITAGTAWNGPTAGDPTTGTGGFTVTATGGSGLWYAAALVYTSVGTADVTTANFADADWTTSDKAALLAAGFTAIS